ncbi:hypothetical protein [Mycobacterium riyadhense]|uniref:hypothetical protein n=1 Tax=Mycobacterium riyadhense TaxID=486698 RepID=UPI003B9695FE
MRSTRHRPRICCFPTCPSCPRPKSPTPDSGGRPRMVPALDKAGNARFVRTITEKAAEYRDYRLNTSGATPTKEALVTLEPSDVDEAFREACVTQRIPFE